jgi:hypothetical protein
MLIQNRVSNAPYIGKSEVFGRKSIWLGRCGAAVLHQGGITFVCSGTKRVMRLHQSRRKPPTEFHGYWGWRISWEKGD